ncbi:MAG TPA: hypothetical protein VF038_10665 [Usitatibacter sp.]
MPAVRVPCPLARSNAGFSVASFAAELSARGTPSFAIPATGTTRSSKKPSVIALTARWWDCSAMRSWSARATFHCFAISSQCSPMLLPVARLAMLGTCRRMSRARSSAIRSMRSPTERAWLTRRIQSESPCARPICTRLMLSTPPQSASERGPPSIPAASIAAAMLVAHASTVEKAGVAGSSCASTTTSRAMLLQPRLGATVPHTTRSGRSPAPSCAPIAFATGTESATESSRRSGPSTRANGVRTPATIQRLPFICARPADRRAPRARRAPPGRGLRGRASPGT